MTLRTLVFWPHLIAGVLAGVVILLMCVTGVLLTYERQLIAWSDRHYKSVVEPGGELRLSVDDLVARARSARPGAEITGVTIRQALDAPIRLAVGPTGFFADAYTGAVMSELRAWHRWISVDGDGRSIARAITGWSNVIFLFIILSGIYLWVPRTVAQLRQNTWFRRGLRGKVRDFNWHNVIGSWLAIPLFIVVISATPISFPWASAWLYRLVGDSVIQGPGSGRAETTEAHESIRSIRPPGELETLFALTAAEVPDWVAITLQLPGSADEHVSFAVDRGDGGQPQRRSTVLVSRASYSVVHQKFTDQTAGRQLRSYMRFGHTGEVLGIPGQSVAGIATAGGTVLVWTGLNLSWRRFRSWRQRLLFNRQAMVEKTRRDTAA